MRILGIDQSYTSTGIVVIDDDGAIVGCRIEKSDPSKDIYDRAQAIATALHGAIEEFGITHFAIEGLAFGKFGNATRDLAGLQFVIITTTRENFPKIRSIIISPNSLKKFATDSGKASKKQMYEALPESAKQSFKDAKITASKGLYDATDAYWIAQYARQFYLTQTVVSDNLE